MSLYGLCNCQHLVKAPCRHQEYDTVEKVKKVSEKENLCDNSDSQKLTNQTAKRVTSPLELPAGAGPTMMQEHPRGQPMKHKQTYAEVARRTNKERDRKTILTPEKMVDPLTAEERAGKKIAETTNGKRVRVREAHSLEIIPSQR